MKTKVLNHNSPQKGLTQIKKATHILLMCGILSVGCAKSEDKENKLPYDVIPEKIVLGGETEGKIAIIINGKTVRIKQVPGAVYHQVMFSKDGRYAFAANSAQNKVDVFDGETGALVKSISVGEHPSHMDIDDANKIVAVVNEDSGDVSFISVDTLEEIARVSGFSTPHFARYYNGFWFVANFSDNRISVVNLDAKKIEKDLRLESVPPCKEKDGTPDECAFFDLSINKEIGMGLASHNRTGTILSFDAKNLRIDRVIGEEHNKLSPVYSKLDDKGAFKSNAHTFGGSIGYVIFKKGVIGYNFVARDIWWVWEYPEEFFSQFGIEYPGKLFLIMHDKKKVAILNSKGGLESMIEFDEIPGEGIYHNNYVYLFAQGKGYTRIYALDKDGKKYLVSEIDFAEAEGIHIPGATPHCH